MKKGYTSRKANYSILYKENRSFLQLIIVLFLAMACTTDRLLPLDEMDIDTDGDGIPDSQEILNGSDKNSPCDPPQSHDYINFDVLNAVWVNSDCDNDGISNAEESKNGTNAYLNELIDSDGDGILDYLELENGTNRFNPCDGVRNNANYATANPIWSNADCDGDGISNGEETVLGTDPFFDEIGGLDTDGDGIKDEREILQGTDMNDPCDPPQNKGYLGYDPLNTLWADRDCDGDGLINGNELTFGSDPYSDDRIYGVPEFLPSLSQLKIFEDNIGGLKLRETSHEYLLNSSSFTNYSYQLRTISLPKGQSMIYIGNGLPIFPDNTILTKTFYYLTDERNPESSKKIIETQVLIKQNGVWNAGTYLWNASQNEANYFENTQVVPVNWVDNLGNDREVDYKILQKSLCFQCHSNNNIMQPIGLKMRTLNIMNDGDQIQDFMDKRLLTNAPNSSQINALPNWEDQSIVLEQRARAYLDINCSHCHQPGGSYTINYGKDFDFSYETSFNNSKINDVKTAIQDRMSTQIPGYFMPLIGTSVIHAEGVALINQYIETLN